LHDARQIVNQIGWRSCSQIHVAWLIAKIEQGNKSKDDWKIRAPAGRS